MVALIHPVFRHIIPICSENSYEDTIFVITVAHVDVSDQLLAIFTTFEREWGKGAGVRGDRISAICALQESQRFPGERRAIQFSYTY